MLLQAVPVTLVMIAAAAGQPEGAATWRLTCDFGAPAPRVFRVGPGVLEERNPATGVYSVNLCESFKCASDTSRFSATIESASVAFMLDFDSAQGKAAWRSLGASGYRQSSGDCRVEPDRPIR